MILEANGRQYVAHFMHLRNPGNYRSMLKPEKPPTWRSVCLIYEGMSAEGHWVPSREQMVSYGVCYTNPSDQFSKEVGRKKSLTRALSEFSRDIRAQLWTGYWREISRPTPILLDRWLAFRAIMLQLRDWQIQDPYYTQIESLLHEACMPESKKAEG